MRLMRTLEYTKIFPLVMLKMLGLRKTHNLRFAKSEFMQTETNSRK